MDDEELSPDGSKTSSAPPPKVDQELVNKYKGRGFQKLSLEEYTARLSKKSRQRRIKTPVAVKFMGWSFAIPIICFGVIFIPWVLFIVATHPIGWSSTKGNPQKSGKPTPTPVAIKDL